MVEKAALPDHVRVSGNERFEIPDHALHGAIVREGKHRMKVVWHE